MYIHGSEQLSARTRCPFRPAACFQQKTLTGGVRLMTRSRSFLDRANSLHEALNLMLQLSGLAPQLPYRRVQCVIFLL